MKSYWLNWSLLTLFKGGMIAGSIVGAIGGILNFESYSLLAFIFVPASLWFLYDFAYQLLVPLKGGKGYRLHKPIDRPMYMGLAPSAKEAKKIIKRGHRIIWD